VSLRFTLTLSAPLPEGPATLGWLTARMGAVPANSTGRVELRMLSVNGAAVDAPAHQALQIATVPGDVTGDGKVDAADRAAVQAVAEGTDSGFDAFRLLDPARLLLEGESGSDGDGRGKGGGSSFGFGLCGASILLPFLA